ncbi:11062_t:CDS:1, partial [Funneliformis geosporum]
LLALNLSNVIEISSESKKAKVEIYLINKLKFSSVLHKILRSKA